MLIKQVARGQDRGLIRYAIADQLDAGQAGYRRPLDQGLFHRRITERIQLLQQLDPQQLLRRSLRLRGQWLRRSDALLDALGEVGLDQRDERLPGHHYLHFRKEHFAFGLLFGRSQLIVREAELLATH